MATSSSWTTMHPITDQSDNNNKSSRIESLAAEQTPNTQLTPEQRQAKRELKRQLKHLMRQKKLENRIKQAMKLNNDALEREARMALYKLQQQQQQQLLQLRNDDDDCQNYFDHDQLEISSFTASASASAAPAASGSTVSSSAADATATASLLSFPAAQKFVMEICQQLQRHQHRHCGTTTNTTTSMKNSKQEDHPNDGRGSWQRRQLQNDQSAHLLQHMTKGTIQWHMFDNPHALHGYTRQKFYERAMLVVRSLYQLWSSRKHNHSTSCCTLLSTLPETTTAATTTTTPMATCDKDDSDDRHACQGNDEVKKRFFWERLCQVRSICSIGCGPGCDAMGVVAFLIEQQQQQQRLQQVQQQLHPQERQDDSISCSAEVGAPKPVVPCHDGVVLDQIIFLDWAISQWQLILQPLQEIITVPSQKYVTAVQMAPCDIRHGLWKKNGAAIIHKATTDYTFISNQMALQLLLMNHYKQDKVGISDCDSVQVDADISAGTTTSTTTTATSNVPHLQPTTSFSCDSNTQQSHFVDDQAEDMLPNHHIIIQEHEEWVEPYSCSSSVDMFLFSYVLSETRDQWFHFCRDCIVMAKPGALFYFSDPTAWQLHRLIIFFPSSSWSSGINNIDDDHPLQAQVENNNSHHYDSDSEQPYKSKPQQNFQNNRIHMDWIWLDSSMNQPSLQCLEGRVGPAVLLGRKL